MILYIIGSNGYFQGTMEYPDDPDEVNGIPYGTTKRAVPEEIPENEYAVWNGSGWYITDTSPPVPLPPQYFIKVTAFYDRFGPSKYDILFSTDEEVQGYITTSRSLGYINLEDPELNNIVNILLEKNFSFDKDKVLSLDISEEERYIA